MPRPKAYDPEPGYKFQILCRNQNYDRAWDHCGYAVDRAEKDYLIQETRRAYGAGWEFQSILLPTKYWPSSVKRAEEKQRRIRFAATRPHGLCERTKRCVEHETNPMVKPCKGTESK